MLLSGAAMGAHQKKSDDLLFYALFALVSLATLIPLWSVRIPPMQDMWQHLALVHVIHNYDAPGSIYPEYFVLPSSPKPNLLYYYLTHLLAYALPSLEVANKVVLTVAILGFPATFLWFLEAFGRSRWLVFFAFPLIYNAFFFYGFVAFYLGIPVLFAGLASYRSLLVAKPERWLKLSLLAAFFMVLAFFTHAHIYLLLCFLNGVLWLVHRGSLSERFYRTLPFIPGLVFFVPWAIIFFVEKRPSLTGKAFGSIFEFFGSKYYSPSYVLSNFYRFVGDHFRDNVDDVLFISWVFLIFSLLIFRRGPIEKGCQLLRRIDLEILTLVLGASVLLLPQHIEAQSIVSLRHVFFALIFFVGWADISATPRKVGVGVIALVLLLNGAILTNLIRGFQAFDQEIGDFPALFERAEGYRRLLRVTYNQESAVVPYGAYWHTHFFYTIIKGGVSDMQFAEYPHNPIQYRPGMVPPKPPQEFWRYGGWRYFDYILVRRSSSPNLGPVETRLQEVSRIKDWVLYKVVDGPVARPADTKPALTPRKGMTALPH